MTSSLLTCAFLALTGCSTGPEHADVADRFLIELGGLTDTDTSTGAFDELADSIADNLGNGYCGNPAYFVGLEDDDLQDAVLITCSIYYDSEMTDELRDQAKDVVLREAVEDVG